MEREKPHPKLATAFRQEWGWVAAVSFGVCLLASLPYLCGYLLQSPELRYAWVAVAPEDTLSYFAKIGLGVRGSWTFRLTYTAQTHPGAPVYLYYLWLGHLAHWGQVSAPAIFHLARFLNGWLLLLTVYAFIARLTDARSERRFVWLLVAFSSGLGWLMLPLGQLLSADLTIPESNTFFTLMDNAHFPLSQTLLLLLWLSYLAPVPRAPKTDWLPRVGGAVALGLLVLVQPFTIVVVLGTTVLYGVALWYRERRWPVVLTKRALAGMVVALPLLTFTYHGVTADPLLREWNRQNITHSPPFWNYLSGYGLLLIPAIPGVRWAARRRTNADLLLLAWVLATVAGLYAPFTLQRRLVLGLHVPIAGLAGLGICRVWMPHWPSQRRWLYSRLYLLATCATTLILVAVYVGGAAAKSPELFLSAEEADALSWLTYHVSEEAVVLSSTELGAFIPAFTKHRAVSGHGFETIEAERTEGRVKRFYALPTSSAERQMMLAEWGADYVLLGPRERHLGIHQLSPDSGVMPLMKLGDMQIYQVALP